MKRMKLMSVGIAVAAVVVSTQAGVDKPNMMPGSVVSISVPDLHGFIDEAGLVASKVQPMLSGASIKQMVGMQIGDPGLAGIPQGKGLAVVALDMKTYFGVLEVSEAMSAQYAALLGQLQMQTAYVDGALLIAESPAALEKAKSMLPSVKSTLLSKRSAALSIGAQPAALIEQNRASIDMAMGMMPMMMAQGMMQQPGATLESAQGMTKVVQGYAGVLLSLAEQCEVVELQLAPEGGDIVYNETIVAKAGTELDKLLRAPVQYKANPAVHAGGLPGGTVRFDYVRGNPGALAAFVAAEAEKVCKLLMVDEADASAWIANMTKWSKVYGGTGCEVITFGAPGKLFGAESVVEVRDGAAALAALKSDVAEVAPLLKLMESFGVSMTMDFKENAREAAGVKVHELRVSIGMTGAMEEAAEVLKEMGLDSFVFEVAIADGLMFSSLEGDLDALMKNFKNGAAKSAAPIKARGAFPAGGFYYLDYDLGGYFNLLASIIPADEGGAQVKQMAAMFQGAEPVVAAGFKQDNRARVSIKVSGDMLAKIGQFVMMMQMQAMQQQGGVGGPGEVVVP